MLHAINDLLPISAGTAVLPLTRSYSDRADKPYLPVLLPEDNATCWDHICVVQCIRRGTRYEVRTKSGLHALVQ